jgi:replicative DNA helicase
MLGCNALRNGVNVLHYTMEMSEIATALRYDSNLCDIDCNDIIDSKEKVLERYDGMKLGGLMIKEFPTSTATIFALRAHMERLELKGFHPGLIIVDYADIMRSTRQYDSLRHELKLIYEELRAFASEKKLPVWSASQSNKDGANSDVIDITNMSEAFGKAFVCDVVLSVNRKMHEKSTGAGRLYVAKNRIGKDGLIYQISVNTARSRFEIISDPITPGDAMINDENDMKRELREKWRQLKHETSNAA